MPCSIPGSTAPQAIVLSEFLDEPTPVYNQTENDLAIVLSEYNDKPAMLPQKEAFHQKDQHLPRI